MFKSKIIFTISIITILGVVGFTTYQKYASLKSIDSYEECIAAKGSEIKTSYPPTCISRLNASFEQQLPLFNPQTNWIIYRDEDVVFEYPPNWTYSPQSWLINDKGKAQMRIEYVKSYLEEWLDVNYRNTGMINEVVETSQQDFGSNKLITNNICNRDPYYSKGRTVAAHKTCDTIHYIDSHSLGLILVDMTQDSEVNSQILSSFHFTD